MGLAAVEIDLYSHDGYSVSHDVTVLVDTGSGTLLKKDSLSVHSEHRSRRQQQTGATSALEPEADTTGANEAASTTNEGPATAAIGPRR
jgi:hypothetical protein